MAATRREGLIVQEVHDEVLVFHPERNEASALNQSAAIVFELCDGEHDVDEMRAALDDAGFGPASVDAVWLALDELAAADLIDLTIPPVEHMGRRELLKNLGVGAAAAAIALPVVETIGAPSASAQGSRPSTTVAPTTAATTIVPTTAATTIVPTTLAPTSAPTTAPTAAPTTVPTPFPTVTPTTAPTTAPTPSPTFVVL
ncbi:MAG: PqqD family protein [Actinomycetota bacterium]